MKKNKSITTKKQSQHAAKERERWNKSKLIFVYNKQRKRKREY